MCIRQIDLNARLGSVRRKRITIVSQLQLRVFAVAITKTKYREIERRRKKNSAHTTAQLRERNTITSTSTNTLTACKKLPRLHSAWINDYRSRFRRILVHSAHTFPHIMYVRAMI